MNRSVSVHGAAGRFWKRHCQVLWRENILIRLFPLNWEAAVKLSEQNTAVSKLQQKCSHLTSGDSTGNSHRTYPLWNRICIWQTSIKSRKCSPSSPHLQRLLWEEVPGVGEAPAAPGSERNWELNYAGQRDPEPPWHTHLQLFDNSLDEVSPKFHPLQALLSQTDGVENGCCDFVCIFCL